MKYCTHCGAQIEHDDAVICLNCGCKVDSGKVKTKDNETMKTIIYIFLILACIGGAFALLIPLLWCVPITLAVKRRLDNDEEISVALKICTLIFVSQIAGILLLCYEND